MVTNERGQSILEVVFVLPFLFSFVFLLYKVMMAEQMAINNTQYARSQLYQLTMNQPEYPRIQFRFDSSRGFVVRGQDKMVLGVADPKGVDFGDPNAEIEPIPQIQNIARAQTSEKGSSDQGEVKKRTELRIRNTAAICTQLNSVAPGKPMISEEIRALKSARWPFGQKTCQYKGEEES